MQKNKLIYVNVDELVPYANNARKHTKEQIKLIRASLREFGFINPVIIDKDNTIIAGHGRVLAAEQEGITEIPCVRVENLSDSQKKAYILADNRLAEMSEWDEELLKIEIQDLSDLDFNVDLTGFDINDYIDDSNSATELGGSDVQEDDYNEPVPEEPKAKLGDIYQLGNHILMCGDSTKEDDVKVLMNGKMAKMLLTDPPYNVNYHGGTAERLTIENDSMEDSTFRAFLVSAFSNANQVMEPGAIFYIWHADSEGFNFRASCKDVGWQIRQCLIWCKNTFVLGRQDYQWQHEPCLYGWKDGAAHLWTSDRKQTTILNYDKPTRNSEHPTMKPIALFDYQIRNNTHENSVVLDLFGGSGTTLIACEQNNRSCRMMEFDPRYVDVIIDRWEKLTGKTAVLLKNTEVGYDE